MNHERSRTAHNRDARSKGKQLVGVLSLLQLKTGKPQVSFCLQQPSVPLLYELQRIRPVMRGGCHTALSYGKK
jgi:hypothetical protein